MQNQRWAYSAESDAKPEEAYGTFFHLWQGSEQTHRAVSRSVKQTGLDALWL